MFEVVPESEKEKISEAVKLGNCVACYEPLTPGHDSLYCWDCDDVGDDE